MTDPSARRIALLRWMHDPDRAAAWRAMHDAGLVSHAEPTPEPEPEPESQPRPWWAGD